MTAAVASALARAAPPLAPAPAPAVDPVAAALAGHRAVPPELLARRALLRRVDTKFAMRAAALIPLLARLGEAYGVLEAGEARVATYDTLYLDAPGLPGYLGHLRGRLPRAKIRIRHYPDRRVSFLEVKRKQHRALTDKVRHPHPFGEDQLAAAEASWALERAGWSGDLAPQARTTFRRITLVGLATDERITVDLDLRLALGTATAALAGLAVVEVKQSRLDHASPAVRALRAAAAQRLSVSKYAVAMALLSSQRRNRFLPTLHRLARFQTC
ncbi:MAG: VTC domain-containing protein [Anaeromyxobacter sp.]